MTKLTDRDITRLETSKFKELNDKYWKYKNTLESNYARKRDNLESWHKEQLRKITLHYEKLRQENN